MTDSSPKQPPPSRPAARGPDPAEREMQELMLRSRMERIGQKLLVLSGKGGVGKSTVAANLAVALARAGRKVGLLDVDVHGPSIPQLLGLTGRPVGLKEGEMVPVQVDDHLAVMSIGFLLANGDEAIIWRGPRKFGAIRQFLTDVAWGRLDYLVIDSPPGTGDEPLTVAQLVGQPAGAVVVTTPQDLAISDVRRCVSFCRALSLPVAGIVENMSGYVCPQCGHRVDLFRSGGGEALAREAGVPFLGRIPIDPAIVAAGDAGAPFIEASDGSAAAAAFAEIVRKIAPDEPKEGGSTDLEKPQQENHRMKIAIPLAAGRLSAHFGHCEEFAIIEVDAATKQVLETTKHTPPGHEPGALPRWLHEMGAEVIIAGGMGSRAQQLFAASGIAVVVGASAQEPAELVAAYLGGTLTTGGNLCDH